MQPLTVNIPNQMEEVSLPVKKWSITEKVILVSAIAFSAISLISITFSTLMFCGIIPSISFGATLFLIGMMTTMFSSAFITNLVYLRNKSPRENFLLPTSRSSISNVSSAGWSPTSSQDGYLEPNAAVPSNIGNDKNQGVTVELHVFDDIKHSDNSRKSSDSITSEPSFEQSPGNEASIPSRSPSPLDESGMIVENSENIEGATKQEIELRREGQLPEHLNQIDNKDAKDSKNTGKQKSYFSALMGGKK